MFSYINLKFSVIIHLKIDQLIFFSIMFSQIKNAKYSPNLTRQASSFYSYMKPQAV